MANISVAICCVNAASTLEAACQSVRWADELVVVDSGSTDATPTIAQRFADRYVVEPWRGYGEQKRYAAALCRNDWVLVLDADEEVSPTLATELAALEEAELAACDVLYMRRRHYVMGRRVRAWWPDWQSRLIHRQRVQWQGDVLHEARKPRDPQRVRRLQGWLEHKRHSDEGFADYFSGHRLDERLLMVAQDMARRGRKAHWWDLLFRPALAFLKFYFIKRGCLDGSFGLLMAQKAAVSDQLKYAALWAVQHGVAWPAQEREQEQEQEQGQEREHATTPAPVEGRSGGATDRGEHAAASAGKPAFQPGPAIASGTLPRRPATPTTTPTTTPTREPELSAPGTAAATTAVHTRSGPASP